MATELWLKARVRKRDRDILQELQRRQMSFGEMADIVREGVRRVLFDQHEESPEVLEPIFAELIEKELNNPEDVEALLDDLVKF